MFRGCRRRSELTPQESYQWFRPLHTVITILAMATYCRCHQQSTPTGPSLCADNTMLGYSNMTTLRKDLDLIIDDGEPKTFHLCQSSSFQFSNDDGPVVFDFKKSSIHIKCGMTGKSSGRCVLNGGNTQIVIREGEAHIFGLTFQGWSGVSILASANATATFHGCQWKDTSAVASIMLLKEKYFKETESFVLSGRSMPPEQTSFLLNDDCIGGGHINERNIDIPRLSVGSLGETQRAISFLDCYFYNCSSAKNLVFSEGGRLVLESSFFVLNSGRQSLVSSLSGEISITDTHFLNNSLSEDLQAIVLTCSQESLLLNERNCGYEMNGTCNGIAVEKKRSGEMRQRRLQCYSFPDCRFPIATTVRNSLIHHETASTDSSLDFFRPSTDFPSVGDAEQSFSHTLTLDPVLTREGRTIYRRMKASNESSQGGMIPCPSDKSLIGYTDIGILQRDVLFGNNDTFLLCPKTVFNSILIIQPPLLSNNFTLKCADSIGPCAWRGSQQHLVVVGRAGPLLNVRIEGITFRNAKGVSAEIIRTPTTHVNVDFVSCRWEGNRGPTSIWINKAHSSSNLVTGRRLTVAQQAKSSYTAGRISHRRKPSGVGLILTFTRCLFAGQKGGSTISVEPPSVSIRRLSAVSHVRHLAPVDVAIFDRCIFDRNIVNGSLIESYYSAISISDSLFSNNVAAFGSLISSTAGSLALKGLNFAQNGFNASYGLVLVQNHATLTMEKICTENNTAIGETINGCKGALIQPDLAACKGSNSSRLACRQTCRPFVCSLPSQAPSFAPTVAPSNKPTRRIPHANVVSDSPSFVPSSSASPSSLPSLSRKHNRSKAPAPAPTGSRSAVPSDSPSFVPSDAPSVVPSDRPSFIPSISPEGVPGLGNCSGTWQELSNAIESHRKFGKESGGFSICAGSVLVVTRPILIDKPAKVQCGYDGLHTNSCKVLGGNVQFVITADGVELSGLTMVGSTLASILATGKPNTSASLTDCEWSLNSGVAAVIAYGGAAAQNLTALFDMSKLAPPEQASMSLDFESCYFSNNAPYLASVVSVAGSVQLNLTYFVNNTRAKVGTVSVTRRASLSVSSSCFIDNKSQLPGSIFVDKSSRVVVNEGNYGSNNQVGKNGECTTIFHETSGTCSSNGSCIGVCSPYGSSTCKAPNFETKIESSSPSLAPSHPMNVALSTPAPTAAFVSSRKLRSSGIFVQTLVSSLLVLGGGAASYFYMKKVTGKV